MYEKPNMTNGECRNTFFGRKCWIVRALSEKNVLVSVLWVNRRLSSSSIICLSATLSQQPRAFVTRTIFVWYFDGKIKKSFCRCLWYANWDLCFLKLFLRNCYFEGDLWFELHDQYFDITIRCNL